VDGNGEIVIVTPPLKSSSTTLKVTIKWNHTPNN
jgi:hypothetical protein